MGSGIKPSDVDPSLPDNKAEAAAAKDSKNESLIDKTYSDTKAKQSSDSLWSSIWGGKKK